MSYCKFYSLKKYLNTAFLSTFLTLTVTHASDILPSDLVADIPHYKAVSKVKSILQTMQARERDHAAAYEKFTDEFKDVNSFSEEKLAMIAPVWTETYNYAVQTAAGEIADINAGYLTNLNKIPNDRKYRQRKLTLDQKKNEKNKKCTHALSKSNYAYCL